MVGNGATNWTYDVWPSFSATAANLTTIPLSLWKQIEENDCVIYFHGVRPSTDTPICKELGYKVNKLTEDLNWYDLYRQNYALSPLNGDSEDRYATAIIGGEERTFKRGYTQQEYTPWAEHIKGSKYSDVVLGDFVTFYMNR